MIEQGGVVTIESEEAFPITDPPRCLDEIAALLWAGYRLLRPPRVNCEHVLVGKNRLPQFRDAKRSELTRLLRWHFQGARRPWRGEELGARDWLERWRSDPVLREHARNHPTYDRWRAGLANQIAKTPLACQAIESTRTCYGRIGGDPETLRAFHHMMEEGF